MSLVSLLVDPRLYASFVLATALMRVIYAVISRAVAPYPRLRALVESVAALMPDVVRATLQLAAVATGRPAPRLDLAPPDPAAVEWERRARAAEARVAELAATSPAAPVGHVDETTRGGRATIAPGMHGMMVLLALTLGASGCSGPVITNPGAQVALRVAWPSVHRGAEGAGLCSDDPPEYLVGPTKHKDAGADDASVNTDAGSVNTSPDPVNTDAGSVNTDAGEAGAP